MSAITVNAIPPLHTFNSSRSSFMALIVLVHLGFFWALTHGLSDWTLQKEERPFIVDFVPTKPTLPPPTPLQPVDPVVRNVWVPTVVQPVLPPIDDTGPLQVSHDPVLPPPTQTGTDRPGAGPLIVPPQADPRFPFTEPDYPVPDIRMGHEGTVWLTIEILPNGRVGAVHIDKSSGFDRLDAAAVREAHKWRMQPGTQDGIAIPMYKRVPVTFRLKD